MSKETALVKLEDSFPILSSGVGEALEALEANLGGQALSAFELPRAKVPSGGGSAWEIDAMDETDVAKTLRGIIVMHRLVRSYWEAGIDEGGGGSPPDCFSDDSINGQGAPGGSCGTCPLAKFGSAKPRPGASAARGQACQQRHQIFMVAEGEMLPFLVSLPPSSLGPMKRFMLRQVSKRTPYDTFIVELGLDQGTNRDGIKYSKVKPKMVSKLSKDEIAAVRVYSAKIRPSLEQVRDDVEPA